MNIRCEAGIESCGWECLLSVHYTTASQIIRMTWGWLTYLCLDALLLCCPKVSCGLG